MTKRFFLIILFVVLSKAVFSQEKVAFFVDAKNQPLEDVLFKLEDIFGVRFSYLEKTIESKQVTFNKQKRTLKSILEIISEQTSLTFSFLNSRYIIVLPNDKNKEPSFRKVQQLESVLLFSYLTKGITKNTDGSFTLKPKKQGVLAGLVEADVLESIQQLPGVISPNETATGFTVRGGSTDQNRIIWDGINMYHKGHLFGMLSGFNPTITQKVLFYNKGTPSQYGERVSSVIDISSNNYVRNKFTVGAGINGINADFFMEVPLLKDKVSFQFAARKSYTEDLTFKKLTDKVFQTTKIANAINKTNNFTFSDITYKLLLEPTPNSVITLSGISIQNKLDFVIFDEENPNSFNDILEITNDGYSIKWDKQWENIQLKANAFFSKYSLNYNFIEIFENTKVSDFEKKNVIFDSGISSIVTIDIKEKQAVLLGYEYNLKDVGYSFINTGASTFILDVDKTKVATHSIFSDYTFENKKNFEGSLGLRVNYYPELKSLRFEPRVLLYRKLFDHVKLQVSGEVKNQIINEIDETILSNLSLENRLWRLADNNEFPIVNSFQVSTGFLYENKGWSLDIDTYLKRINGLTALSLGFLNPDNPGFHTGKQEVMGLDFYLKKNFDKFAIWGSYTFSNVQSKFIGLNNDKYFTAATNINHFLTTSILYKIKKLEMALAWHWHTGKPYTLAITDGEKIIGFDGINTKRLPNYDRLDFSSTYRFYLSNKKNIKCNMGLSIRNVYNKKNHLSREYTGNNTTNDPISEVDKYSLGFTPNFVLRITF